MAVYTFTPTTIGETGTIQSWTVPTTGQYVIEAKGAAGANGNGGSLGGNGAYVKGTFNLTAGQVLKILVGQMGIGTNTNYSDGTSGGGGGGSYVAVVDGASSYIMSDSTTRVTPLIIAAGGGGGNDKGYQGTQVNGLPGSATQAGTSNANNNGGGWNSTNALGGIYGASFLQGGKGGTYTRGSTVYGGFGGGGTADDASSGGGGWTGGQSSNSAPAYSYNSGTSPTGTDGQNNSAGQVVITAINSPPNPTSADAWFTGLASNYPWTNVTSATVNWNFKDPDAGDAQSAYQVVASNDGWATWTKNTGKILDANARASTISGLTPGTWHFAVYVWDNADAASPSFGDLHLQIDQTAPTIGSVDGTQYKNSGTTARVTAYNVADTGGSGISRVGVYWRYSSDGGTTWGGWNGEYNATASGANYYYDFPTASGIGKYDCHFRAYDNAGNVVGPQETFFYYDNAIPVITSVSAQQSICNSNSATVWAYGVTDNIGVTSVSVNAVRPDGSYYLLGNATKNGTTNDYSYNVTDITIDGLWRYDFRAYDACGNVCNYGTTGYAPAYVSRTSLTTDPAYKTEGSNAIVAGTIGTGIGNAITAYGHCWATTANPTTSNSFVNLGPITVGAAATTSIGSTIGPLTLGTTYYVRAYVTNAGGTFYGSQITVISGTVRGRLKKGDLLLTGQVDETNPPVSNGLVGYFPLNGSGKRAAGTVGLVSYFPFKGDVADRMNANSLTVIGATPDSFGGGYVFTNVTDRMYLNAPISSTTLTVEMYYSFRGIGSNGWNSLLARDGGSYHHIMINSNNEIGFYNAAFYSSGYKMIPGREYHIQLVKNGTNHWLYIDGQLVQYDTGSFDNVTYPLVAIGNYGGQSVTGSNEAALGIIRELKIYNTVVPGGAGFGCNKYHLLTPNKTFNGTSDFVNASSINLGDMSKGFHFRFRARWDALNSYSRIFDLGNGAPSDTLGFYNVGTSQDAFFMLYTGTTLAGSARANGTIIVGELAEWIVDCDANKNLRILKNGVVVATGTTTAFPTNIARTNMYIGKSEWGDPYFKGYISYVHFYDRPYDEVNNTVWEDTDVYLSQPTTNLWTGDYTIYNNYTSDITTTLVKTSEALYGSPVWNTTYKPITANGVTQINSSFGGHGVYGSSRTYTASTYYTASIYWRCSKPSVTMDGTRTNLAGWSTNVTVDMGNGWKRSTVVWYSATGGTDQKFWGFKDTAATLNDIISIDWACPQIEQRGFATAYALSARAGMGKFWMPTDGLPIANAFTYSFWFNLPHMHTQSDVDSRGIQGNWYHPIIELTPMTMRNDGGFSFAAGPTPTNYNRRVTLPWPGNLTGTIAIQDNTWYHGAITYDGANYKLYVNGVNDITYASTAMPTTFADTVLMVGGGYYGAAHAKVKGLSIYNRALSTAEITKLYKNKFSLLKTGNIRASVINEGLSKPDWIHYGLSHSGVSIDKQWKPSTETNPIYTQDGAYIGAGTANLFTGIAPWCNNGATQTDVSLTEPGPIRNSPTWKFVKTGTANQWNGWQGNYNSMSFNTGDYFTSSGWYRTNAAAGVTNFDISFHTTDWARAINTTTIYDNTKIIADGQWHQYSKTVLVNEYVSAIILDTNWGYSTQAGTLYMNGMTWTKTAYPVPSPGNGSGIMSTYSASPITVVVSNKDTYQSAGRKLVRLSNGWFVAATFASTGSIGVYFYVSKDEGQTWSQLCYRLYPTASDVTGYAIVNIGMKVTMIMSLSSGVQSNTFDAGTITNIDIDASTSKVVDSGQTAQLGSGVSIAIDGTGVLHAVWSSKNATYPNSFNIRYSKSTDNGATWAAVTQISNSNTSGWDTKNPCIVIRNGNPVILVETKINGNYNISSYTYSGSVWSAMNTVYSGGTAYPEFNPSTVVSPDGNIHVAWMGTDATDNNHYNIWYAKSTDGGTTWPASTKLTSGNVYNQKYPSITADKNNNIYCVFHGIDTAVSSAYYNIRRIIWNGSTWGAVVTLTNGTTADQTDAQTLFNYTDFTDPLVIYKDFQATAIKFRGAWTGTVPVSTFTHPNVSLPANVIDVSKDFTIMGWFTPGQITTGRYEAVLTRESGSYDRILIMTEQTANSTLNVWYGNPTTASSMTVAGSVVEAFKTQFFALMRSGTNLSLYFGKDGVITSVSRTDATLLDTQAQTGAWKLGQWGDADTINGYMKDLSFIRYALTDQQIKDYYHTQMRSANSDGSLYIQGQVVERQVL